MRRLGFVVLAVLLFVLSLRPAGAHTTLRDYIQHRATVTVGPRHIDVSVELTFYEDCSVKERRRMDADGDGRIADAEIGDYLSENAERFGDLVSLTVDGRPVELIPLFEPRVDLQGNRRVVPHFHVLTLEYFVRTPEPGDSGSALQLKDGLWAEEKALHSVEVAGRDGIRAHVSAADEAGAWRVRYEAPHDKN